METSDPFTQLVDTLAVIENQNRILCLLSVYLGQKADLNTIQGITDILSCLLGKDEKFTVAKTRGLITSLVNGGILEREREKIISSTKVSFHTISPLGYVVLVYVLMVYVLDLDPADPTKIEWDVSRFQRYADSEQKLVLFIIDTLLDKNSVLKRVLNSLRTGKAPNKVRLTKPVLFSVEKVFSGKTGNNVFKIYEELIWDYLHLNSGLTKENITSELKTTSIGSYLNRLSSFLMIEEKWGKTSRYRISSQGVLLLPIFSLLIKHFSVDKSIFPPLQLSRLEADENLWLAFTKLGYSFFKSVYQIP
jgi:hypothetical protein